jgi:hypothetical protein
MSGKSFGQIARELNAAAVSTDHGGARWWPSSEMVALNGQGSSPSQV